MVKMQRLKSIFFAIICCAFIFGTKVIAAEDIKVMEVNEQGENPVVYLKGAFEIDEVQAVIGNVEASHVNIEKISEKDISMKTIILIDNSLSVPERSRDVIKDIVSELIAGRKNNEQFAIATFGEEIEILTEFTDDYTELKNTINNIEFQDRETYLTDILYNLVEGDYLKDKSECYIRIFVISDGVDNKSLGYTTEELRELLMERTIPVYTLGVYNKKATNTEELKKMFAFSRQTNADYFLLNEVEDYMTIVSQLAKDHEIVALEIIPDVQSRDGSEKTIQLEFMLNGERVSLQVDNVRMSLEKVVEKIESVEEETVLEMTAKQPTLEKEEDSVGTNLILIIGIVSVIVAGIILVICYLRRKTDTISTREVIDVENPFETAIDETNTILVNEEIENTDGETILLFDNIKKVKVTLTDIDTPARSFTTYMEKKIVIGRAKTGTDICIDYDRSVSREQCAIEKRGNKFYLIHLQPKSDNKTYLNENQVLSEVEISSGGIIRMGRVRMRVEMS